VPTLLGKTAEQGSHEYLYWEWDRGGLQQAVRHGRWKLVSEGQGDWQVFDLWTDLSESTDVASEHRDLIADVEEWISANRTVPE